MYVDVERSLMYYECEEVFHNSKKKKPEKKFIELHRRPSIHIRKSVISQHRFGMVWLLECETNSMQKSS